MNELLTVMEMANFLKISRTKAYELIKRNDFPFIKIDKSIRINRNELLKWLNIQSNSDTI